MHSNSPCIVAREKSPIATSNVYCTQNVVDLLNSMLCPHTPNSQRQHTIYNKYLETSRRRVSVLRQYIVFIANCRPLCSLAVPTRGGCAHASTLSIHEGCLSQTDQRISTYWNTPRKQPQAYYGNVTIWPQHRP